MSDTMKLALTFTAVDAASGYIAGLEQRIDSLGEAGKRLRGEFDAMKDHFAEGLKGLGVAYSTMQFMKPGIEAAALMQESGIALSNSLADSGKAAAQMAADFKEMKTSARYISEHSPFKAEEIMRAEKLLKNMGFGVSEITGKTGLASKIAGLSQIGGVPMETSAELAETFRQQFGAGAKEVGEAFDAIAKNNLEGKIDSLASGMLSIGTRAAAMKISPADAIMMLEGLEKSAKRAGPVIGEFLGALHPSATSSQATFLRSAGINFYDGNGNFIGLEATQRILKEKFGSVKGNRLDILKQYFGEAGAIGAEGFIKMDDLAQIAAEAKHRRDLAEKQKQANEALSASYETLSNAMHNTLASVMTPMTEHLAIVTKGAKSIVSAVGGFTEKHQGVSEGIGLAAGGVAGLGAAYTLYRMGKALASFRGVTGGLSSVASGLAGYSATKAALTQGVTPVFVMNWPNSLGGAASDILSTAGGAAAGAAVAKKAAMKMLPFMATAGLWSAGILGAGLVGWNIGKAIRGPILSGMDALADKTNVRPVDWLGDKVSAWSERRAAGQNAPKVNVYLAVDKDGRTLASTDMNTDLQVKKSMLRGDFYGNPKQI